MAEYYVVTAEIQFLVSFVLFLYSVLAKYPIAYLVHSEIWPSSTDQIRHHTECDAPGLLLRESFGNTPGYQAQQALEKTSLFTPVHPGHAAPRLTSPGLRL